MNPSPLSVTEAVSRIKKTLESDFRSVLINGEVSNLAKSSGGHWYFTLSDKDSSLSAALFKGDSMRVPLINELKNGDKVSCFGSISVYLKRGTFQLIVKQMRPTGQGDLKLEFEKLKNKLAKDGLFDLEVKQKIPRFPKKVAVITAERGAALQDFLNIYKRRSQQMEILLIPSAVQGEHAAKGLRESLIRAIKYNLDESKKEKIDVVVLTRGGGSLEDLWSFNDEALAWEIFNCPIPVISAVGHQVDYSISDFVADLRCETPSAAAEILTEEQTKIVNKLSQLKKNMTYFMNMEFNSYRDRLIHLNPNRTAQIIWAHYNQLQKRISKLDIRNRIEEFTSFHQYLINTDDLLKRLNSSIQEKLLAYSHKLEGLGKMVHALGPQNVLERGYTYIESSKNKKVISRYSDFKKLSSKDKFVIHFSDGIGHGSKKEEQ